MFAALSTIDYGLLLLYFGALLAVGLYFSGRRPAAVEFFLGNRTLDWLPLGMSLAAALAATAAASELPGRAYERGLMLWLVPAALWLALPIVAGLVIPIYRGLGISSIYEYLELRYDRRVRRLAGAMFVACRLMWLAAAIALPARAAAIAGGWTMLGSWWLIGVVGLAATAYTALGGMRAVAWASVLQGVVVLAGVLAVIVGVWLQLDGGPARVAEVAEGLGRTQIVELSFDWRDAWSVWAALPFWLLAALALLVTDQTTAQRLLAARSINAARTAYVVSTLGLSLLLPALAYAGLCLLAFYQDHPQAMRARWVVNLDGATRQPIAAADGRPLLEVGDPAHEVRWENIDRLVAAGRLLRPNNKEPFTSAEELIDPETNRVLVEKLAMRRPPLSRPAGSQVGGEWIVARGAAAEMLPQFAADFLPWGAAGLAVAALLAAALASFDSSLHSIATVLVVDFHRQDGWGGAPLARPLVLVLGLSATACASGLSLIADALSIVVCLASAVAGPLLAVFLLGMLTRRTTAAAALWAAIVGSGVTLGVAIFGQLTAAFAEVWPLIFGTALTALLGYALSALVGQPQSPRELRGLVAGCGALGVRSIDEITPLITVPEEEESRWR